MKTLKKLFSYAYESTALSHCKNESEKTAVKKHFSRLNKDSEVSVKTWIDRKIEVKLNSIAESLPSQGYSMGGTILVYCSKLAGSHDYRSYYSNSCSYSPKHGRYSVVLKPSELINTEVIGGLVTYIPPGQKSRVKKCYWYERYGSKQFFELVKVHGFIFNGYHSTDKESCLKGGLRLLETQKQKIKSEKSYRKALNCLYSYEDSITAGNCDAGTKAFILRCGLSSDKKYKGSNLLKIAGQKSTNSVSFINRMISYKAGLLCK